MIISGLKEKMVKETVPVYKCTICDMEFEGNDQGESAAKEHSKTHADVIYGNHDEHVYLVGSALVEYPGRVSKQKSYIRHKRLGYVYVEWEGDGWYVYTEYESWFRNEKETKYEFRHVSERIRDCQERIRDAAEELKTYRGLSNSNKPVK